MQIPIAARVFIVQNGRAWGRVTRYATPLELAEISRLNALLVRSSDLVVRLNDVCRQARKKIDDSPWLYCRHRGELAVSMTRDISASLYLRASQLDA